MPVPSKLNVAVEKHMIMQTSLTILSPSLTSNGTSLLQFHHAISLQSSILITFPDDHLIPSLPSSSFKPFPDPFPSLLSINGLASYFTGN